MEQQEFWNEKNLPVPNFLSYPASRREIGKFIIEMIQFLQKLTNNY